MPQFELTLDQLANKESIRFSDLKTVVAVMSKAYDSEEPPLGTWGKIRSLTLECLSLHTLTQNDDPIPVLASLINARAYCGEFGTADIDDSKYLEVRTTAEKLALKVSQWSEGDPKNWMMAALEADIAVTDLRRMGRGFINADYEEIACKLSTFLEQIWLVEHEPERVGNLYREASDKFSSRVLGWMLEAILRDEKHAQALDKILSRVDDMLNKFHDTSNMPISNAYYSGVSSIAGALLDHAVNEDDLELKAKVLELADRALEFLEKVSSQTQKDSYWYKDLLSMKEKRGLI